MQKIKSITLRNFKFFYGNEIEQKQNKLELDSNNLLLYGENGSGKSSIYWAIYTFLQSCLKHDQQQIEKYFESDHGENLRNRFAENIAESGIIIELIDTISGSVITEEIGSWNISTFQSIQIKQSLVGSDFINYKFLSKLYDFRNSEGIDLFRLFERDIFMFIDFEEAYTLHNGTLSESTYASDWWKFISEEYNSLPKNTYKVAERTPEYMRYQNETIPRFIALLKRFLIDITQGANEFLQDEFKESFTIGFDVDSIECVFNKRVEGRNKQKDGVLHKPKIPLHVNFNHEQLAEEHELIQKPHTFLNEASLTAIALAIRLAILDRRPIFPNAARLLILDDLLLSLDMSHRDRVLDIVLSQKFIDTYQLLIFTHDRAFYNLCRNRINDRFSTGWVFQEMYQDQTVSGIPCPFVPENTNYLDKAKKYLKNFDYPACANYLRKETERILSRVILPKNLTIRLSDDQGSKPLQLEDLIKNFFIFYKEIGGDITPFRKLKEHKDLLLNPLSHDDISSPVYKRELLQTLDLLISLNKLKVKIIGVSDVDDEKLLKLIETDSGNVLWEYSFTLKETFRAIQNLEGLWLLSNPKCKFISRKQVDLEEQLNLVTKLNKGHDKIRHALGIKVEDGPVNDLKQIVSLDGVNIIDILNANQ